ncbi:hypothetical protein QC762_703125 [Podospora pseudocomata]|uniref:Uncharacterized protein n=1 Tax=Podospora pseudocomata TaxID=2093779 RepID=A0ABR0G2P9_9PEZI|nr:hypothetical protein QC762_703125 [Podospora pseudocomata]
MDWPLNDPKFIKEDLEQFFAYQEKPQRSKAVGRFWGSDDLDERPLHADCDVREWLELSKDQSQKPGLSFILASCHEATRHNPAHLRKLSFTYEAFQQITSSLPLHGDTARIISRSDLSFFEEIDLYSHAGRNIYYCCRTSGLWAEDLAVSCVFNPKTGFTSGVVFGCSDDVAEEIAGRIENAENSWMHPLLMIGIVAEIERTRHMKLVEDHLFKLLQRVQSMSKSPEILPTSQLARENYSVDLWIEVSQLRIALVAWRAQLCKMDAHIQDLEKIFLEALSRHEEINSSSPCSVELGNSFDSGRTLTFGHNDIYEVNQTSDELKALGSWHQYAREEGRRIQKRLREIIGEYDCKLRECSMVLDGVSLSAQLSLFSMTFFNWDASEGEQIVSPYVWIYSVAVVPITAVVVGLWYYLTKRTRFSDTDCTYG